MAVYKIVLAQIAKLTARICVNLYFVPKFLAEMLSASFIYRDWLVAFDDAENRMYSLSPFYFGICKSVYGLVIFDDLNFLGIG